MSCLRLASRLADLPPYVAGRRPEKGVSGPFSRLASNESPWTPQEEILEAMRSTLGEANRYPDMHYVELREAIASTVGSSAENVAVANGSTALLRDLLAALADDGSEVIFAEPSFVYYCNAAVLSGAVPVPVPLLDYSHDLTAMHAAITSRTRAILVCNPNNPTGTAYTNDELRPFLQRVPKDIAVILDEAYSEYASQEVDGIALLGEFENLIVVRTLSKAHGLAGLRVGYAVGPTEVASAASRIGVPFRIDAAAAAGAIVALQPAQLAETARRVQAAIYERDALTEGLRAKGWPVAESQANFVFIPHEDASSLAERLKDHGILARPVGAGLRISVGTAGDTDAVLAAFPDALSETHWRLRSHTVLS